MKKSFLLIGSGIFIFSVLLSGCNHKKNLIPLAKVGDSVIAASGDWPVCKSLKKMREIERQVKKAGNIAFSLTNETNSCAGPPVGHSVIVLAIRDFDGEGVFYQVKVPKGIIGWTTSEFWMEKNPLKKGF